MDDGDAQGIAFLLQLPGVLRAEAMAPPDALPYVKVIYAFVEEVLEVVVHSLRAQTTDGASLLVQGIV